MTSNGGRVQIGIDYKLNKAGLNDLKQTLQEVQKQLTTMGSGKNGPSKEIETTVKAAQQLESILNDSWNSKLNQLDLNKVNTGIKSTFGTVQNLKSQMEASGVAGSAAYNKIASAVLNTNLQLKQSNKLLDDMADTMAKTVKWGITSSIFNRITGSIQEAWGYTKRLDNSLNDIRIVTEKSAEAMQQFAREANNAAKSLGASTTDYTEASLIYFQQGLSDEEVAARAQTTIKAANVTGQSAEEVSEQLTAVWNGYKASAQESELYVDKLAAVAASTAADLEELSTGMSKVASAANSMGVDIDQLNAQLATIVSVTRQAPESVGTALKTIYARLGDLAVDGEDEFGVALGTVSKTMEEMGIQILDEQGQMREMGEVIEETAAKWDTWTEAQRQAAAVAIAGKRQYNNLVALFENWDMYTDALNTSVDATGTLQKQQDIYMESMEAHLQQMSTEAERTYDVLFNEEVIKDAADAITGVLTIFNDFIEGVGGGANAILYLGTLVANVFNKQIGNAINNQILNLEAFMANRQALKLKGDMAESIIGQNIQTSHSAQGQKVGSEAVEKEATYALKTLQLRKSLNAEEYNRFNQMQQEIGLEEQKIKDLEKQISLAEKLAIEEFNSSRVTSADFQERLAAEKEMLDMEKQRMVTLDQTLNKYQQGNKTYFDSAEQKKQIQTELLTIAQNITRTDENKGKLNQIIRDLNRDKVLSDTQIKFLLEQQEATVKKQSEFVDKMQTATEGRRAAEQGTLDTLKREQEARERILQQQQQQKERQMAIQQAVRGATAGVQAASAIMGSLVTLTDESSNAAEKANAVWAGTSGTISAVANYFLPGSGILVQGALSLVKSTLELTGLWDTFEDNLKSSAEELEEANAAVEEMNKNYKDANKTLMDNTGAIKQLEEIKNRFIELQGLAEKGLLTSDLRSEYDNYLSTITRYNEDIMTSYDAQGNLIASNSKAIENTIAKLQTENELLMANMYNSATFAKATETKNIQYKSAQEVQQDTLTQLNESYQDVFTSGHYRLDDMSSRNRVGEDGARIQDHKFVKSADAFKLEAQKLGIDTSILDFSTPESIDKIMSMSQEELTNAYNEMILSAMQSKEYGTVLSKNMYGDGIIGDSYFKTAVDDLQSKQEDFLNTIQAMRDEYRTGYTEVMRSFNWDPSIILNDLKYNTESNAVYEALLDEGVNNIDNLLNDYMSQIDYTIDAYKLEDGGINYEQIRDDVIAFENQLLDLFKINPEFATIDIDFEQKDFKSYAEYLQAIKDYINQQIEEHGLTIDQAKILGSIFGFDTDTMVFTDDGKLSSAANEYYDTEINKVKNWIEDKTGETLDTSKVQELSPEIIKEFDAIIPYIDDLTLKTEGWQVAIEEAKLALDKLDNVSILSEKITISDDAIKSLIEGKELTDEQREALQKLEDEYVELSRIQDKNSTEYLEKLISIREALEEQLILEKEQATDNLIEKGILLTVDDEEFQDVIEGIVNRDYDVLVEIKADMQDDFDDALSIMDQMEDMASKIGDDFIVSARDLEELGDAFPGILDNIKFLADGTAQLDAAMVQTAMRAAQDEVTYDTQKTVEKLQNQKIEFEGKRDAARKISELAEKVVNGEAKAAEVEAQIDENLATLKSGNSTEVATQEKTESQDVAETAALNATSMANSYSEAYQKMAQDSARWAEIAKNNIQVGSTGVGAVRQGSGFNTNWAASSSAGTVTTAEKADLSNVEELTEGIDWESVYQYYDNLANAYDDAINNTEGKIAELLGRNIDLVNRAFNVSEGLGIDGEELKGKEEENVDFEESLEKIYDRYYDINIQLDLLETNLERVQKQQEKLTGKAYIQNLQQQLDILNKQIEANKTKLSLTQQEMAEIMLVLETHGANFDTQTGQVTNYEEVINAALAEANEVIATYNGMKKSQQEAYKAIMESAKESYNTLVETFERFDELYTEEIPGLVDTIQEALDQAVELKIEQFNTEIQIDLDLKDAERQWNDFYAEIVKGLKEDDLVGQSELSVTQLGTYASKDGNDSSLTLNKDLEKLAFLNSQANQIISGGWSNTYGDNIAALLEDLNKANDQLITDMTAAKELADGVYDNYLTSIDKVIEGNDDVIGQFEFLGELLDHNQKLIGILGANNKASDLTEYYAEKNNLNQQMIAQHAENAKYYQQMMDSIGDKTSEEWQKWSEAWQEEVSNLNAAIIQGMEDAAAAYANAIELAMQEMESAFTDGLGFEYIQDEWDLTNENAEKYLDTINSAYEISKLENKFVDAINNTSSLSAQKKLTAAMREEIKLLENADKISQYDIDRANLKYELTLKQIALEEAQANKTSMRLQRDSQGNYGYVFAADQDEIAKAQEELANAENELYNFDKEAYNKKIESVLKAEQDLQSKLQEIWTNESLSEEQKLQYTTMINEQYRNIIEADVAESEKMKENLANTTHTLLLKTFNEEVSQAINTGLELDRAAEQTVISMNEKFKGLINPEDPNSTVGSIAATFTEWSKATGQMVQNAGSTAVSLNSTFDNSFTSISASVNKISDAWGAADNPNSFAGRLSVQALNLVGNLQSTFNTGISAITSKIAKGDKGDGTSLEEIFSNSMLSCQNASLAFQRTVEEVARQAGIALGNAEMGGGIYGSVSSVKEIMRLLTEQTNEYSNRVTGENGALVAAQNLSTKYEIQHDKMSKLNSAMLSYNTYLTNMANKAAEATKQANALTEALNKQYEAQKKADSQSSGVGNAGSTAAPQESHGGGDSYTPPEPPPAPEPQTYTVQKGDTLWDITGGDWNKINAIAAANGITDPNKIYTGENLIIPYDTGGYTGDWHSSQGKIAMLHEKEIVLNKADTANILDVVSMVREMTSSSLRGANGMMSGMLDALASVTNNSSNSRQEVYITAEFPNATSVADIEEAFRSLPNIASQYAFSY